MEAVSTLSQQIVRIAHVSVSQNRQQNNGDVVGGDRLRQADSAVREADNEIAARMAKGEAACKLDGGCY